MERKNSFMDKLNAFSERLAVNKNLPDSEPVITKDIHETFPGCTLVVAVLPEMPNVKSYAINYDGFNVKIEVRDNTVKS